MHDRGASRLPLSAQPGAPPGSGDSCRGSRMYAQAATPMGGSPAPEHRDAALTSSTALPGGLAGGSDMHAAEGAPPLAARVRRPSVALAAAGASFSSAGLHGEHKRACHLFIGWAALRVAG